MSRSTRACISSLTFPSPRGDKLCRGGPGKKRRRRRFPSPRGDKLCPIMAVKDSQASRSFRPLAGISCVQGLEEAYAGCHEFPSPRGDKLCLGGIRSGCKSWRWFPSPRGDKLCLVLCNEQSVHFSFRPLAGISCVAAHGLTARCAAAFPSPRGDKLCLQNCPTGACGIGPGSDRITISHSTATGKWQLEIKIPLIFLREPLQTAMQVAAMETRFAQSADSH